MTLVNKIRCIVSGFLFLQYVMMAVCVAVAFILRKHNPGVYMEGGGGKQWTEHGFPDHSG